MDCDGLKKNLLTDLDGSLFGQAGSVVSQADALWGKFSLASALNPHRFCFGRFTATWGGGLSYSTSSENEPNGLSVQHQQHPSEAWH